MRTLSLNGVVEFCLQLNDDTDCVVYAVEDDDDDDDEDEEEEIEKVSVPLTVTMGLVAGFIFMGSVLFGVWEGWDWLSSAYYCFITISTIGFGDLVPGGDGFQTTADNLKMIAAAAYIVFGMAIMSMAFNLIQAGLLFLTCARRSQMSIIALVLFLLGTH